MHPVAIESVLGDIIELADQRAPMIRVPQRFEFIRFVAVRAIVDMALAAIIGVILVMVWHWSLPAAAGVWGLAVAAALLLQAASRRLHV